MLVLVGCILFDDTPYDENVRRLTDNDGDGWSLAEEDCNDGDPRIHPEAVEDCDGLDNDCDHEIDELPLEEPLCRDMDGDGHGDPAASTTDCDAGRAWVERCDDCDDGDRAVHPGATETCNGLDDDCDGAVDPATAEGAVELYVDEDGDGYGQARSAGPSCEVLPGTSTDATDCNDAWADTHPGAKEVCFDGRDNDCDGTRNGCGWEGEVMMDTANAGLLYSTVRTDSAGISVGIVDVSGDGQPELLVTGAGDTEADNCGVIYVWAGAIRGAQPLDDAAGRLYGTDEEQFVGWTENNPQVLVYDVEQDGVDELLYTALGPAPRYAVEGAVMRRELGIYGVDLSSPEQILGRGELSTSYFGAALYDGAPLHGGAPALLVGAYGDNATATRGGGAYLVDPARPDAADALGHVYGTVDYHGLGYDVHPTDDLDGDGVAEVLLGAQEYDGYTGAFYLVDGPLSGSMAAEDADLVADTAAWVRTGNQPTALPDMDGDGYGEIAVSTAEHEEDGTDTSRVIFVPGNTRGNVLQEEVFTGALALYDDPYDGYFGDEILTADFFGDGTSELLIGASAYPVSYRDHSVGSQEGAVFIVPLPQDLSGSRDVHDAAVVTLLGPDPQGYFGGRIAAGDVNLDGIDDLLVGSSNHITSDLPGEGAAWFIQGGGI